MKTSGFIPSFRAIAQTDPGRIALADRDGSRLTTYGELDRLAGRMAAYLLGMSLPPGSFIPIVLPAGMEYMAAELGVWLAGHAIVPLGEHFPQERIDYIREHCQAPLIVDEETFSRAMDCEPAPGSDKRDPLLPAALFYTSGSTGNPKGIVHTFESLEFSMRCQCSTLGFGSDEAFGTGAPFYFIASVLIYDFLSLGAAVHLYPEEARSDVRKLEEYIERHGITTTFISPAVLGRFRNRAPELRRVITGSERLAGIAPDGYELWNGYGLTESGGPVVFFRVDRSYENTPVGRPAEGAEVFLIDENGQPIDDGREGELCLKGKFTPGYFREEEATRALYRDGLLHTGDIARRLPDGNCLYVNRKDWMVKINGQRVEPGEAESALKRLPGIENAIVKGFTPETGGQYLCAYYIAPEDPGAQRLREALSDKLPAYMIPSYFVRMERFPLNANGKLDRKSLLPPDRSALAAAYEAPRDEIETALCGAFARALGLERIGIDDDFFALGGDSIRVMSLLQSCPTLALSSKTIYRERTVRRIASHAAGQRHETLPRQEDYPLSQSQAGIYAECMNRPGEAVYNNPRLYRLGAGVDPERAARAVEQAVAAHPFIRTRLTLSPDGEPRQRRNETEAYRQSVETLTDAAFDALIPELVRPFDLLADELFRIRLFRTESAAYLFLDFHHLIYDGTSHSVLQDDLNAAYRGQRPETERWSGFETAQQEELSRQTEAYAEAESWARQTFGELETESLPLADRHEAETRFGRRSIELTSGYKRIEAFCRETGVTANVLATAAFGYLLGLYANDTEALFATIYHGRSDLRTARTIGMLVKTLPVHVRWQEPTPTREYLTQVKERLLEAMHHDIYPFAELSAHSAVNSRVLFAYQGDLPEEGELFGAPCDALPLLENATGEPLTVQLFRHGERLTLTAEYHENRYSPGFIERLLQCYEQILNGMLTEERLERIDILSEGQLRELDGFNATEVPYDDTQTVVSLFRRQAALTPEATALVCGERSYTYREADELSERIGQRVRRAGIARGEVVSILIPRCEYMAIASLGVLKAGCAYQPLDPTYPPERLSFMVQDAGARLLIADEALRPLIADYAGGVLPLSELPGLPDTGERLEDPAPGDLFTLLYTSGSTGQPKGCRITHANLTALCDWYRRYYELQPGDRVGAYASYGFDANMMDMYPALTGGAACCIVGEEIRLDLAALSDYFERHRVTHAFMTTQVGRQFALEFRSHPTLKHLSVGGEKLVPLDPPAGYRLYNLYGPTECTILTTAYRLTRYEEEIPIGTPLSNLKLYVADRAGRRLPVGAVGELWIAGRQVSEGYLNREEQTRLAYIPNPFDREAAYGRIYRSGDIVRYRSDGNVEFIGRRDAQVKIRGFRIELTEVEAVVREYPGIEDATVAAFDDPGGGKFIAAYVVSREAVDTRALGAFIRERKPPYMVPAVTLQIDRIPLNQNMKVNKRALPVPEFDSGETPEEQERSLNLLEEEIVRIAGGVLSGGRIGLTTDLGYLGLTSISAIRLSVALFKRFGVNIPSKTLIAGASIQQIENEVLRHWMEQPSAGGPASETTPESAPHTPAQEGSPLSYAQQGVYYDCMKHPDEVTYNVPALLSFAADTDADRLEQAVRETILAHPYVMSRFEMRGEEVVQRPAAAEFAVARETMDEPQLAEYKKAFVRPFDLADGPLFRLAVVRTPQRVCLLLDFHHLIFDGASLDLFFAELKRSFEGRAPEGESYSYYDYVSDEKRAEGTPRYEENRAYFERMLARCEGASEITPDLNGQPGDGSLQEWVRPLDGRRIKAFCREHRTTPAALCLAAACYTVGRYVNSRQVYLSTISNGRGDVRTAGAFGMFVKTLPLAASIDEQSVGRFIAQAGRMLSETVEHEDYPFARISADHGFAPQIVYACQLGVLDAWMLQGRPVSLEGLELRRAKFKLSIHIEPREGHPAIVLQYNDALYSRPLMEGFAESMAAALDHMIDDPQQPVRRVSLLGPRERERLEGFRRTGPASVGLFHHGLERQARLHPDRTALMAAEGSCTYAELNACAERIAAGLMRRGVAPRSRVALLLPRTGRVVMSMFGVMKSGCAYIPCDPAYPAERIGHILEDSQAACLITTADRIADFGAERAFDVEELLSGPDAEAPRTDVSPDDLAYLIYTSGSTGKPKGVMLTHAGICNYLSDDPRNCHVHALVTEAHSFLSVTTVSFDMSLKEIGTTLYNGLTLVLADETQANNPILLAELFARSGADAFNATPSRMMQYLELPAFCVALSKCKVVMCGGEKYPEQLLDRLRGITRARIFNTYGPTEITVSSNGKELTHAEAVTIGRPLLNYREYVVDADGNELPPGVVGELYIGGVGVARGYHNLPEMTRERFIRYRGERVYKSGDYARWTPEGEVVILGRSDNQVKLRGLRIELGEIESCIAHSGEIRSVVVAIRRIHGGEHLCAYFTADRPVDTVSLKERLKQTLAPYMVPTAYLQLDSLPLTPNGKTDLKALPEPRLLAGGGEAPDDDTERCFCDIFARVLGLEQAGATDSFFELGGTSLSVARIIIEANKAGFPVAYGDVFAHPSPRGLASLFRDRGTEPESGPEESDPQITAYDYSALQPVLEANTLENFLEGESQPLGDVLLTGATGYLGIHLLKELLDTHTGTIYCLLRSKGDVPAETRLKTALFYYFERTFEEAFDQRIVTVEGDVTRPESLAQLAEANIATVLNCAANVKHFSEGNDIEAVNVGGVENLIGFCLRTGARLVHVSTMSVGGLSLEEGTQPVRPLNERTLYFGQLLDNKYIRSKFLAERLILEHIRDRGLNAKIMRVGNLSARHSDGEFQINYSTNTFMGRLKAYRMLGLCAYGQLDSPLEFSPIDEVAKAILRLSISPRACCVFHPYNHHFILLGDIFARMEHAGFRVEAVEEADFAAAMAEAEADPRKARVLSSIIAYRNMAHGRAARPTPKENAYTMQVLYRLGYRWPYTSWDYVTRLLNALQGLGFFDD